MTRHLTRFQIVWRPRCGYWKLESLLLWLLFYNRSSFLARRILYGRRHSEPRSECFLPRIFLGCRTTKLISTPRGLFPCKRFVFSNKSGSCMLRAWAHRDNMKQNSPKRDKRKGLTRKEDFHWSEVRPAENFGHVFCFFAFVASSPRGKEKYRIKAFCALGDSALSILCWKTEPVIGSRLS